MFNSWVRGSRNPHRQKLLAKASEDKEKVFSNFGGKELKGFNTVK